MLGHYPEDGLAMYREYLPEITEEDMKLIHQPLDFYGQNIYNGKAVISDGKGGFQTVERAPGASKTAIQWSVTPECLRWGPRFLYERYGLPVFITENGMSAHDTVSLNGKVLMTPIASIFYTAISWSLKNLPMTARISAVISFDPSWIILNGQRNIRNILVSFKKKF